MIHNELLEEVSLRVEDEKAFLHLLVFVKLCLTYNPVFLSLLVLQLRETEPAESVESLDVASGPTSGLNLQEVMKLIGVFEPSFSFLLLQLIKLMTTMKRKPR